MYKIWYYQYYITSNNLITLTTAIKHNNSKDSRDYANYVIYLRVYTQGAYF